VTLFPELVRDALRHGVLGRAQQRGLLEVGTEDPRAHTRDVHKTVDDRPYGGGPGMVMKPEPLSAAIGAAMARLPEGARRIALSAQGRPLTQQRVRELATSPGLLLVAGRYEGIDERVIETLVDEEVSIGDYVLSGGELPALVLIDALARLLPGALGDERSAVQESFSEGLLDWPHYTRPEVFEGRRVPLVLQGGDHAAIARWRLRQAVGRTWERRPDLRAGIESDAQRAALLREYLSERGSDQ
jgi:tRNA (guanine37-N1)-methyltransferase